MLIHKEMYTIAKLNEQKYKAISRAIQRLESKTDIDGLKFEYASFVEGCVVKGDKLYDSEGDRLDNGGGLTDGEYFCRQHTGHCEDDFYGVVYFPTKTRGLFVAVPFEM